MNDGEVTRLIKAMGRKPKAILAYSNSQVISVRNDILACQRRITLARLIDDTKFHLALLQEFGRRDIFESDVFNPTVLQSFLGCAQLIQSTGFLVCHVNENPEEIATLVLKQVNHNDFLYLVWCAIPAFFGFFCSKEHCDIAFRFYKTIAELAPQKVAITIFHPLLHSGATFRFIECALTKFMNALIIDVNVDAETDGYVPIYSQFLVRCIIEALPLLPDIIMNLFKLLRLLDWDNKNFGSLFFVRFLWPSLLQRIENTSASGHGPIVHKIITYISSEPGLILEIYQAMWKCTSNSELPSMYNVFGHQYLDFYVSIRSVHAVAKILHTFKAMPETVTIEELMRVPAGIENSWYNVQIYPHIDAIAKQAIPQLFEGNSPEVKLIEKLADNTLYKKELLHWLDVLHAHETICVMPFIAQEATAKTVLSFTDNYRRITSLFNIPRMNRCVYLALIEQNMKKWLDSDAKRLEDMDTQWNKYLMKLPRDSEATTFPEIIASVSRSKGVLVDAIRQLATLDKASFYDRFHTLVSAMGKLMFAQKTENLPDVFYPVVFQQNHGTKLLSTFIILNCFAMRNPVFQGMCSDDENVVWLKLESAILMTLNHDKNFLKTHIEIQEKLSQNCENIQ